MPLLQRNPRPAGNPAPRPFWRSVIPIAGFLLVLVAPRCHAGDAGVWAAELTFQAVHCVDAEQTLQFRHYPTIRESSDVIGGGWVIGGHPRQDAIVAYMGAEAVLHAGVTLALVHWRAPAWAIASWESVTIAVDAVTVDNNARIMHVEAHTRL